MSDADIHYNYRPPLGSLKLCGILMVILSPITLSLSFQQPVEITIRFIRYTGPVAVVILWLMSLTLLIAGVTMTRSAFQQAKEHARITLTDNALHIVRTMIRYRDISDVSILGKEGRQTLYIAQPGGKLSIRERDMASPQEFNELHALLADRVQEARIKQLA